MDEIFPYGHFSDPLGIPNQKILVSNQGIFSVNQCFLDHIKETQLKVRVDYTCPELQKLFFNVVINHGPLQYTVL